MLSADLDSLHSWLCRAAQTTGLSRAECWTAAAQVAALRDAARRLEDAAVPLRVRALPQDLPPNVVRFETAGSLQSRRMVRDLMLWPAAVLVPMALAALAGMTP